VHEGRVVTAERHLDLSQPTLLMFAQHASTLIPTSRIRHP
jgi:hypothetical protein